MPTQHPAWIDEFAELVEKDAAPVRVALQMVFVALRENSAAVKEQADQTREVKELLIKLATEIKSIEAKEVDIEKRLARLENAFEEMEWSARLIGWARQNPLRAFGIFIGLWFMVYGVFMGLGAIGLIRWALKLFGIPAP